MPVAYIPHTEADIREMLATIGVNDIEDLLAEIPKELRIQGGLNVPDSYDEHRLLGRLFELSRRNKNCLSDLVCFLGAGIYDRYIPASVGALVSRGEFLTAYTPYQPEFSQGYLQTIYEFQTMIAELYDMDVANASMYDGATAMAEAAILASGANGRSTVVVGGSVHPHYRQVLETYCWSLGLQVAELPISDGATADFSRLDGESACLVVQSPNFFGCIEDLRAAREASAKVEALLVVVADPTACAILPPPGSFGADIAVGEGQPLGIAMGFGGPALGLFACRQELVRRIPGRIVGRTTDGEGRTGYVMTLRTREQDIRREKATSNICTNEALMALCATIYLAALGKSGIRAVAESTVRNTQYALGKLASIGLRPRFGTKVFGEFTLALPRSAAAVRDAMLEEGFLAGLPLGDHFQGMENDLLVAVTETRSRAQIDAFAAALARTVR